MKSAAPVRSPSLAVSPRSWTMHLAWMVALGLVWIFVLPEIPSDWGDRLGMFSSRSLAQMVVGLALVQALGGLLSATLGGRASTVMTGILGGFISSTAVAATAARNGRTTAADSEANLLLLACSTIAMLLEAFSIVKIGLPGAGFAVYVVIAGPLLVTFVFAWRKAKNVKTEIRRDRAARPDPVAIGRLALFLVAILTVSRLMRHLLGRNGLVAFTFIASFFEIHATVISNTALRAGGGIEGSLFTLLLALSIGASFLSKLFIVRSLGTPEMFRAIRRWVGVSLVSVAVSTALALSIGA